MGKCTARRLSLFENLKIEVLIINSAAIRRGFIALYRDLLQPVLLESKRHRLSVYPCLTWRYICTTPEGGATINRALILSIKHLTQNTD